MRPFGTSLGNGVLTVISNFVRDNLQSMPCRRVMPLVVLRHG